MSEIIEGVCVFRRGADTETVVYADLHVGAWWILRPGGVTYSHDRESLLAWMNGDRRRFGPGQDCYDAEGRVERCPPSCHWTRVVDAEGLDEIFETLRQVHLA